jgi:hypothetical protein
MPLDPWKWAGSQENTRMMQYDSYLRYTNLYEKREPHHDSGTFSKLDSAQMKQIGCVVIEL